MKPKTEKRTSDTALMMSFSAWLLAGYRLDVSAQASEFMSSHSQAVSLADYAGMPVELISKLRRDGNPAEFLTMQDIDNLVAFIEGQRDVINAQQRRIAQLIEDDGVRRNGARIERENLQQYVAGVEAERDRLAAQVEHNSLYIGLMNKSRPVMNKVKLTAPGQIKRGCRIHCTFNGKPQTCRAKEILNAGTDKEEILIDVKQNIYFITSMAIDGSSWAKDVYFETAQEADDVANNQTA